MHLSVCISAPSNVGNRALTSFPIAFPIYPVIYYFIAFPIWLIVAELSSSMMRNRSSIPSSATYVDHIAFARNLRFRISTNVRACGPTIVIRSPSLLINGDPALKLSISCRCCSSFESCLKGLFDLSFNCCFNLRKFVGYKALGFFIYFFRCLVFFQRFSFLGLASCFIAVFFDVFNFGMILNDLVDL